jgi:hypothetical protein
MKMRVMLMVAMLALSGSAYAQSVRGDHNNDGHPDCGQGACNQGGGDPRDGGNGNGGNTQGQIQGQAQGQLQLQGQAQQQNAVAVAENSNTNSASVGDTTNTNTSAATVGDVNVTIADGALRAGSTSLSSNYQYKEVQQAPSIGQGSFAISGCNVGGNAGGSGPGWSGFLGFGFTPDQCYDFMLAQAYQSIGEKKAVCDILRNSKAGKRQEKRGIVLPECKPEVVVVPVVVAPPPVDAVTHEELNRAFKASQSK